MLEAVKEEEAENGDVIVGKGARGGETSMLINTKGLAQVMEEDAEEDVEEEGEMRN